VYSQVVSTRDLIFKNRFCNTLDGASDQDVAIFAEELEQLFPRRPEVVDPLRVAKKLSRNDHRLLALRRAVQCVINNLLIRNMSSEEKLSFRVTQ
jgi:hypothetical protein